MNLFQRLRQSLAGAPLILFFIGLPFFGVGAVLTYQQIIFRQVALQVPGEVINLSESCDNDGCVYSPIVRFTTLEGETAFYNSTFGSYPPDYDIGEAVSIFYKYEDPEKAIIAGEGSIFRYIFIGVGSIIILSGLVFYAINLKNSYLAEE